jgi:alpha/beta superfamily hydrolase
MFTEPLTLHTADALALEAELRVPDEPWAAAVLAHPHPRHGGNMRSIVPGALFDALPAEGVACLRFNFRGIGRSEGEFGDGLYERADIVAALDALHPIVEGLPLIVAGWSFGADTALAVGDERLAGWCAIAPPLRIVKVEQMVAAHDPRPKLLVVPEHDQYRSPDSAREVVAGWVNTRIEVVPGSDHFFIGRIERVPPLVLAFLRSIGANYITP